MKRILGTVAVAIAHLRVAGAGDERHAHDRLRAGPELDGRRLGRRPARRRHRGLEPGGPLRHRPALRPRRRRASCRAVEVRRGLGAPARGRRQLRAEVGSPDGLPPDARRASTAPGSVHGRRSRPSAPPGMGVDYAQARDRPLRRHATLHVVPERPRRPGRRLQGERRSSRSASPRTSCTRRCRTRPAAGRSTTTASSFGYGATVGVTYTAVRDRDPRRRVRDEELLPGLRVRRRAARPRRSTSTSRWSRPSARRSGRSPGSSSPSTVSGSTGPPRTARTSPKFTKNALRPARPGT